MSQNKREVLRTVKSLLLDRFPHNEGWELTERKDWKGYKIDFVVEKREDPKRLRSVIKVVPDGEIRNIDVKNLNSAARRMSGRYVKIHQKIFAVPNMIQADQLAKGFETLIINGHGSH